jgi:hypothetical protein
MIFTPENWIWELGARSQGSAERPLSSSSIYCVSCAGIFTAVGLKGQGDIGFFHSDWYFALFTAA